MNSTPSLHCTEHSPIVLSEPEPVGHIFLWIKAQNLPYTACAFTITVSWMCPGQEGIFCMYKCLRGNDTQGNFLGQREPCLLTSGDKMHSQKMKVVLVHLLFVNIALYCRVWKTVVISGHLLLIKLPSASGSADFSGSVCKVSPGSSCKLKPYQPLCNGEELHNMFWLSTCPCRNTIRNKHLYLYASYAHGLLKTTATF